MVAAPIEGLSLSLPLPATTLPATGAPAAVAPVRESAGKVAVTPVSSVGFDSGLDDESLRALEAALNARLEKLLSTNLRLQIDRDRETGHFIYKSIDIKTGELHRQFPAEDILRMLKFFRELDGLLFDAEA